MASDFDSSSAVIDFGDLDEPVFAIQTGDSQPLLVEGRVSSDAERAALRGKLADACHR
jgi:hypothetical protein